MFLVLILSLSMIICTAAEKKSIHVTQIPERAVILKGANVTFHCIIPLTDDSSGIEVRWRKQGENGYIQNDADSRKRITINNRAGGYFHLLNTTYQDSGNYGCVVLRQGEIRGEGTGSELTVCALPTPLKLNWISERNSSAATTLVCETAEFHPGDLTLLWYKNSVAVTAKADTIKQKNSEGLYTASTSIPMTQSEANGNIYICLVIHISLQRPAIAMHALRKPDQEGHNEHLYIWASGSAVGGIAILVFVFIIVLRCSSTNKKQRSTGGHEESVEANNILTYSAVDMSSSKRKWTHKSEDETAYAKVKQGAAREVLTYASVALSQPGNAGKVKARDKITEYAALQTANPRRVKEDGK